MMRICAPLLRRPLPAARSAVFATAFRAPLCTRHFSLSNPIPPPPPVDGGNKGQGQGKDEEYRYEHQKKRWRLNKRTWYMVTTPLFAAFSIYVWSEHFKDVAQRRLARAETISKYRQEQANRGQVLFDDTKIVFPASTDVWVQDETTCSKRTMSYSGGGTRCMAGMCWLERARAYSFALYVAMPEFNHSPLFGEATGKAPTGSSGISPVFLSTPQDTFFDRCMLSNSFTKAIRLEFATDMAGSHLVKGFQKNVGKRLQKLEGKVPAEQLEQDRKSLMSFAQTFKDLPIVKGTLIEFSWTPSNNVTVSIDNKVVKVIESKAVAWALFAAYMDADPLSADAKTDMVRSWSDRMAGLRLLHGGSMSLQDVKR